MRLSGLVVVAAAAVLLALAAAGWQQMRHEQQQLRAALAAAGQRIAAAEADRRAAQAELAEQLRALEALRRQVRTPAEVARVLPAAAGLPAPVHLEPAPTPPPAGTPVPEPAAQLVVPAEDVAPLWNFVADCRADRLRLETCQRQLEDADRTAAALRTERDAALRAVRGSFWQRAGRAVKWMAIGAVVGALAARH
jgi:type II secretory pathway pseudopilin PulG